MNPSSLEGQEQSNDAPAVGSGFAAGSSRPQNSEPGSLVHPTENDIILGRGVLHAGHAGNIRSVIGLLQLDFEVLSVNTSLTRSSCLYRFYQIIDAHIPGKLIFILRGDTCIFLSSSQSRL